MNIELLTIYTLSVDGTSYERFLVNGAPVELVEYSYSSERMGATQLTATVRNRACLDTLWTGREFVCLDEGALSQGGVTAVEKFFLSHTPSSSKSNEDERYVHTLEFRAFRDILLSGVYFCDAVNPGAASAGKPSSNSYEVKFVGTLDEFVQRFSDVLAARGLSSRFSVSIESAAQGTTESKEITFSNATLADALQAAVETWEVPFYFLGDSAVFGSADSSALVSVEYGAENELLSVSMNNRNEKRVTRISGVGSSDNVPYYYPNPTPKGTVALGGTFASGASIADALKFAQKVGQNDTLTYEGKDADFGSVSIYFAGTNDSSSDPMVPTAHVDNKPIVSGTDYPFTAALAADLSGGFDRHLKLKLDSNVGYGEIDPDTEVCRIVSYSTGGTNRRGGYDTRYYNIKYVSRKVTEVAAKGWDFVIDRIDVTFGTGGSAVTREISAPCYETVTEDRGLEAGADRDLFSPERLDAVILDFEQILPLFPSTADLAHCLVTVNGHFCSAVPWCEIPSEGASALVPADFTAETVSVTSRFDPCGWYNGTEPLGEDLSDIGIAISGTPSEGDTLTQVVTGYVTPTGRIMPSIYRDTAGAQRSYDADNTPPSAYAQAYVNPDTGQNYVFEHEYDAREPHEHVEEFDVKPTIANLKDGQGNPLNVLNDVYFDTGYNVRDLLPDGEKLRYNHFFVKLKPLGFNLFDCAIENGEMAVVMSDGPCAGCHFKILVTSTGGNPVQKNANGTLKKDADGYGVIDQDNLQPAQQDTTSNAVWIALGLDDQTFGGGEYGTMPAYDKAANTGVKPASGNAYVLENILLPQAFFTAAEQELDRQMVRFMWENNADKFDPAVSFSRIYLAENPTVRAGLSDHSRLSLTYDGRTFSPLYVSQITLNVKEGEALPEIQVQTKDVVEPRSAGLDEKIAVAVGDAMNIIQNGGGGVDFEEADKRYLRKDAEDTAAGKIKFEKGLEVGPYRAGKGGIGGSILTNAAGESFAEFDFLNVRRKATFTEVEVEKLRKVGGSILLSLADITVSAVEKVTGGYKCWFLSQNSDGGALGNGFVVGDQAICQTFDNDNQHYLWRLVTEVGSDYIILSDSDYDTGSDAPEVGDVLVQLGNRSDSGRQAAQILSCYGTNTPSHVMYAGINSYSLAGKDVSGTEYRETSPGSGVWMPLFFNYGLMFLGGKGASDDYVSFVPGYTNAQQEYVPGAMEIKANVVFKAGQVIPGLEDLSDDIDALEYLKNALPKSDTIISGGLILSKVIALRDANDNVKAGMNGDPALSGIAAWYGGGMTDRMALDPDDPDYDTKYAAAARTLFRFDGSGYLAGGNIHWDENGYGGIPGITWSRPSGSQNDVITIGSNVILEAGQGADQSVAALVSSVNSLQQILDWFEEVNLGTEQNPAWAVRLKKKTVGSSQLARAFVTYGDQIVGSGTPGGGGSAGKSYLHELLDVYGNPGDVQRADGTARQSGDLLGYNSTLDKWVAIAQGAISPDLSDYYTKSQTDSAIATAITALGLGAAATYDVASSVTQNDSTHLVTGAAVYSAINTAISSAIKFQGITTTALTDGSTTNPITIDGQSFTAQRGDEVIYGGKEFLWTGSKWQQLGDEESWANKTITISAGTGLTGGGNLESNRTISLSQDSIDKLGLAASALQSSNIKTLTIQLDGTTVGSAYNPIGSANHTVNISKSSLSSLLSDTFHPYGGSTTLATFKIGGATITWHAASGNTPGYLEIDSALVTQGDQIVVSGTPGGGGGGAGWLYELGDVYGTTAVLRADGTEKQVGDVLQYYDSTKGWVAVPSTSIGITTDATQSAHGLMSAADKTKLDYVGFGTAGSDYVPVYLGGSTPTNVLTAHQSLAGYVTLATAQSITGTKYFKGRAIFNSDTGGGYNEGVRCNLSSSDNDAWSSIVLGGAYDSESGTGVGVWTLCTYHTDLYLGHNGSSGATYGLSWTSGGVLNLKTASLTNNNYTIWHAGNFTPSDYQPLATAINTGNIGSQSVTYAVNATRLYASDSPHRYGDSDPYYAYFTYNDYGDQRWYMRIYPATPTAIRVDYASSATNATYATYDSSGNQISTHYLPLSGGTLQAATGNIFNLYSTAGANCYQYFIVNGTAKAAVGYYNGFAFVANEATYARIGVNDAGTPQYWSSTSSSDAYTLYHSGNANRSDMSWACSSLHSYGTSYIDGLLVFSAYSSIGRGNYITSGLGAEDIGIRAYDGSNYRRIVFWGSDVTVSTGSFKCTNIISAAVSSTTSLSTIPSASAILLQTGSGGASSDSVWLWRTAWSSANYGIFYDDVNDVVHFVGGGASQFSVNLSYGDVSIGHDLSVTRSIGAGANVSASTYISAGTSIYLTQGAGSYATGYISAGGGYSPNSGKYGVKVVACDQSDVQSGLGQDCMGDLPYDFSVVGGKSGSYGHISFVFHDANSTTYNRVGYFNQYGDLYVSRTLYSNGDQVISSDLTKKTNFQDINLSVEQIANAPAVTFDWKSGGHSFGSIAQYWKPLLGEMVLGEEGNYSLAYAQGAFVNAIINARAIVALQDHETEQDKEIRELKDALGRANEKIEGLEKEVERLRMN